MYSKIMIINQIRTSSSIASQVRQFSDFCFYVFDDCVLSAEHMLLIRKTQNNFVMMPFFEGIAESKFSNRWHRGFLRRHKQLSLRVTKATSAKKMKQWNQEACDQWIELLTELADDGFLDDPDCILNLDESSFKLGEDYKLGYALRRIRHQIALRAGDERIQLTVLAAGFASGRMLRPLVLYDGLNHLASRFHGTEDEVFVGVNNSGNMDGHVLTEYAAKEIFPNMKNGKVSTVFRFSISVLFIVDSYVTECAFYGWTLFPYKYHRSARKNLGTTRTR